MQSGRHWSGLMNDIEELLGDTTDYLQSRIREDRVLRERLREMLRQGMRPNITRVLGPELPGDCVRIVIEQIP